MITDLSPIQAAVLQVLSWQTPGYLCSPDASAFVSQGIEDVDGIKEALIDLQYMGFVEFITDDETLTILKVKKDEHGKPIKDDVTDQFIADLDEQGKTQTEDIVETVDSGWVITDAGRTELM
jgi:hypothetical protein